MKSSDKDKIKSTYNELNNLVQGYEFKSMNKKDNELLNKINYDQLKNQEILKNIKKINKLYFSELDIDIQTLGFYIVGKVVDDPLNFGRLHCIIQDENGDILTICFYKCAPELAKVIKKNYFLIIFDPVLKIFLDSTKGIKIEDEIDHERLMILSNEDLYFDIFQTKFLLKEKTNDIDNFNLKFKLKLNLSKEEKIEEYKNEGNSQMKLENFFKACELYTKGIELDNDNLTLLSNRAESFIKIGCYNSAIEDCRKVLNKDSLHKKCRFRLARSLEQLGNYDQAEIIYKELKEECGKSTENTVIYNDLNERIDNLTEKRENKKGNFMFSKMFEREKLDENSNYEFKQESFMSSKIKTIFNSEKGVSLISSEKIDEGELLIFEKPLVYVNYGLYNKIRTTQSDNKIEFTGNMREDKFNDIYNYFDNYTDVYRYLTNKLKQKLNYDEKLKEFINTLYFTQNKESNLVERKALFDKTYKENPESTILDILSSNSFLSVRNYNDTYKNISYGLWRNVSFINHSCTPNAFYFGLGPYLIMRSISKIDLNEEITISYCEPKPYSERIHALSKWSFECRCHLCENEKKIFETKYYKFVVKKLEKLREYISRLNIKETEGFYLDRIRDEKMIKMVEKWVEKILATEEVSEFYFINFIFFKSISNLILSKKEIAIDCYEKAIKYIENKSIREYFEILLHFHHNLKNDIQSIREKEVRYLIESYFKKLFTDQTKSLNYIMKLN